MKRLPLVLSAAVASTALAAIVWTMDTPARTGPRPGQAIDVREEAVAQPSESPVLLVDEASRGRSALVPIEGELGMNEQGCMSVGGAVLVAPFGSTLRADAEPVAIQLHEIGAFQVGDQVRVRGNVIMMRRDNMPPERFLDCMSTEQQLLETVVPFAEPR